MIKNNILNIILFLYCCLISSHVVAMDYENTGNYSIGHFSKPNSIDPLTWVNKDQKNSNLGYYAQVIDSIDEIKKFYTDGQWELTCLWSILPAEDGYYTIKNIALDYGLLGVIPSENSPKVQILDGASYESSMYTGDSKNNVLWKILKDENSDFYIIRSKINDGFLSLSNEGTHFGKYVTIMKDSSDDSFLEKNHPMRKYILWDLERYKLY